MWIMRALMVVAALAGAGCNDCPGSPPHCPGGVCGGGAQCVDGQWQCVQLPCGPDLSVAAPADLRPVSPAD